MSNERDHARDKLETGADVLGSSVRHVSSSPISHFLSFKENHMSKSATVKSDAPMGKTAKHSMAKSRFTTSTRVAIGAGALVLAVGGLILAAKPGPVTATPATVETRDPGAASSTGRLTALRTKYNFGSISMARGKVTYRYAIRNTGTEPIFISKLYTSCMCTTAAVVKDGKASEAYGMPGHAPIPTIKVPVGPTEAAAIEVVFDPAAHGPAGVGPIERVVTVENSAGQPLELEFAALVTP
jgi:hypothetical protein